MVSSAPWRLFHKSWINCDGIRNIHVHREHVVAAGMGQGSSERRAVSWLARFVDLTTPPPDSFSSEFVQALGDEENFEAHTKTFERPPQLGQQRRKNMALVKRQDHNRQLNRYTRRTIESRDVVRKCGRDRRLLHPSDVTLANKS